MWRPFAFRRRAVPKIAKLALSVPPLVKTTSLGLQPSTLAARSRASSRSARACRPTWWTLEGLPQTSPRNGSIAARTCGSRGVVAL